MSLRLYAYLFGIRRVLQIAAVSMAFGCLPSGFDLVWTLVASLVAAPLCVTFVLTGQLAFGMGDEDDTLDFLRASDGAWCAFSIERAGETLVARLHALPGFAPSAHGRDIDGFAYWWLWRAAGAA